MASSPDKEIQATDRARASTTYDLIPSGVSVTPNVIEVFSSRNKVAPAASERPQSTATPHPSTTNESERNPMPSPVSVTPVVMNTAAARKTGVIAPDDGLRDDESAHEQIKTESANERSTSYEVAPALDEGQIDDENDLSTSGHFTRRKMAPTLGGEALSESGQNSRMDDASVDGPVSSSLRSARSKVVLTPWCM